MDNKKISNKKFTDEEILRRLIGLSQHTGSQALKAALDLISRQKAEIEMLKGSVITNNIMESQRIKRETKTEAYKEFAERLKEKSDSRFVYSDFDYSELVFEISEGDIDNLLKEMVGEEE